jgi:hypothetical protein
MGKGLVLSILFFTLTPITLIISLFSLKVVSEIEPPAKASPSRHATALESDVLLTGVRVYASLPSSQPTTWGKAQKADARAEIIRQYLIKYDSPLVNHAQKIVEEADKNGLDYRLITAIAQQESNLCKKMPANTYNCWGWGIHSQGTLGFDSFESAIEIVSQGIKQNYINKGLVTTEEIMKKYTPLSRGSWAYGVDKFMAEME